MTATMETFIVVVFMLSYIGIAFGTIPPLALDRTGFALLGAIILVAGGALSVEAAIRSIDTPTILLLYALMIISAQLRLGGFYTWAAFRVARWAHAPRRFLLLLMVVGAFLSALLTNDVICLAFTPIVCAALLQAGLNPVPFLLGLAMASNIGSASTIIGNPQNILIGQVGRLDFGEFIRFCLPPSVILLGATFGILVLLYNRRWERGKLEYTGEAPHLVADSSSKGEGNTPSDHCIPQQEAKTLQKSEGSKENERRNEPSDWPPFHAWQTTKGLLAVLGVVVLFFTSIPRELTAMTAAGLLLLSRRMRSRWLLGFVDWHLLTLFCGLFIIIAALWATGLPAGLVARLKVYGIDLHNVGILSIVSVILSNLVSNVPATMLLLKFVEPGQSVHTYYALALSSTYAGNLITLGSIANLIVIEQAKYFGIEIGFREYARAGVPVTVVSLLVLLGWLALMR